MVLWLMKFLINIAKMTQNEIKLVIGEKMGETSDERDTCDVGSVASDFEPRLFVLFERCLQVLKREKVLRKNLRGHVCLNFVTDGVIQKINKKYRHLAKPTDVISLSYLEKAVFPGDDLLGEIFISVETAEKQAKEMKKSIEQELEFLFVHGVLHVFGYDHRTQREWKIMFELQNRVMRK